LTPCTQFARGFPSFFYISYNIYQRVGGLIQKLTRAIAVGNWTTKGKFISATKWENKKNLKGNESQDCDR
jgi:hypothetical protein